MARQVESWMDEADIDVKTTRPCKTCKHEDDEHSFAGPCTIPKCSCFEFIKLKSLQPAP